MEILEIPCIDREFSTTMSVHVVTLLTIYLNKTKPNKTASVSCYKEVSGTYAKGFYKSPLLTGQGQKQAEVRGGLL